MALIANHLGVDKAYPRASEFEAILYAAQKAHARKTEKAYPHIPATDYETCANTEGWEEST